MMKVDTLVRNGAARFDTKVQITSILEAVSLVTTRYPKVDIQVRFPIDSEGFLSSIQTREPGAEIGCFAENSNVAKWQDAGDRLDYYRGHRADSEERTSATSARVAKVHQRRLR
jgi:hypothetical protein